MTKENDIVFPHGWQEGQYIGASNLSMFGGHIVDFYGHETTLRIDSPTVTPYIHIKVDKIFVDVPVVNGDEIGLLTPDNEFLYLKFRERNYKPFVSACR